MPEEAGRPVEVAKEATEGEEKLATLQARRESTVGDKIAATGAEDSCAAASAHFEGLENVSRAGREGRRSRNSVKSRDLYPPSTRILLATSVPYEEIRKTKQHTTVVNIELNPAFVVKKCASLLKPSSAISLQNNLDVTIDIFLGNYLDAFASTPFLEFRGSTKAGLACALPNLRYHC